MSRQVKRARVMLLYSQLRWLLRLRWIAATLIIIAGVLNLQWLELYPHGSLPIIAGAALGAINLVLWIVDRRRPRLHERLDLLYSLATAHLAIDLSFLLALALWTGGAASPVLGFFIFHMVFASLLQPGARAYVTAAMTIIGMAVGVWATNQWPDTAGESLTGIGWAVTALGTVYLSNRIARALYRREIARDRQNRRLRAMTDKLRAQHAVLVQQDKMAAMGQLAAGVAHEINNPLASMDGVLQLLQRNPSHPRPEMIAALREQVQRIQRTVRQLTAFAHPGDGRLEYLPVNDVVKASMEMLAFDRRLRQTTVETSLDESTGSTRLNQHALGQVLANLLRNALDAMEESPTRRLTVSTRRAGGECRIEIRDSGCGIEAKNLQKIFEPFFTTKSVGRGTGLGLPISAKLMREQGGRIEVESRPGEGTCFVVSIPARDRAVREGENGFDPALRNSSRFAPAGGDSGVNE
ncbi:MAG: hypothetical protein AMXMBFR58_24960 [Phycisphaerae bacterium]